MLRLSLLMLLFRATVQKKPEGAGPLSSCSRQAGCLEFDIRDEETVDANGDKQYSLCLWWDETNSLCYKDGGISHACPVQGTNLDEFKVENWAAGQDNKLPCITVSCGQTATFGVKDGPKCDDNASFDPINDYNITCSAGGSCGGNAKACEWTVKAPKCDDDEEEPPTTPEACVRTPCAESDNIVNCETNDCSCQWMVTDGAVIEDGVCVAGTVSANAFARSKDVYHTNELQTDGDEAATKGGLGHVVIQVETLIFVGALLVTLLLIVVCVCGVVKRAKARRGVAVVTDDMCTTP